MTNNTGSAHRILGTLRTADGKGVVRIEDRYDTDIQDLWSALTDPDRLARWYGEIKGDLRVGGEFSTYVESAGLHGFGRVEVCEPPQRLRVVTRETDESWQQGETGPQSDKAIEARLTADGDQTLLVIEAGGLPVDKVAFYGAGWQIHAENLAAYVTGRPFPEHEARWNALVPPYQDIAARMNRFNAYRTRGSALLGDFRAHGWLSGRRRLNV
jgi:uncharacterized protein YndB with AHSA1/START domain